MALVEPGNRRQVVGAVLAGGKGSPIGGSKAMVELAGRALICYPLSAVQEAGLEPVVVAKRDTELPPLDVRSQAAPGRPSRTSDPGRDPQWARGTGRESA
jgi:molybdopterin-guanine dinucleotide biosynthesis protein A